MHTDTGWTVRVVLLLALLAAPQVVAGDPPSCAQAFPSDPLCIFAENFQNSADGTVPAGWGWPINPATIDSTVSFGNGKSVKFVYFNYPTACQQGQAKGYAGGDVTLGTDIAAPNRPTFAFGETYWAEWTVRYSPDYYWTFGCDPANGWGGNSNTKDIDFRFQDSGGGFNRLLWGPVDGGNSGFFMGMEFFNYAGTDRPYNWGLKQNQNLSFKVKGGDTVHFVIKVLNNPYPNGRITMWANNTLVGDWPGIQTCRVSPCVMDGFHVGGPKANTGPSGTATAWYGQIRITRTNIAPGSIDTAPAPNGPSNLLLSSILVSSLILAGLVVRLR